MFKKKEEPKIGLDIGDAFVKIVQLLEREGGLYELTGFGVSMIEGPDVEARVNAVKAATRDAGVTAGRVNAAVSGQSVIVRYIVLPKMNKSELDRAARFEAEKYLPFNINDVILDPHILGDEPGGTSMRVLLVAAKKKVIEDHVELLRLAGFVPDIIDIDSFALINAFALSNPGIEGAVALVNIGSKFTNLSVIKNYVPFFTRDIAIGGNEFAKALSYKLEVDAKEAYGLIKEPKDRQEELGKIAAPVFSSLVGEISLSFDYYENQLEHTVDKVFISGGACCNLGLDKFLGANLTKPVAAWSCIEKLRIADGIDREKLGNMYSMLSVAVGLAVGSKKG